jgi:PAS domain S-box-containing protein
MNLRALRLSPRLNASDWIAFGSVVYGVPIVLWLIAGVGHRLDHQALVDLSLCPPGLAATVLCLRAGMSTGLARKVRTAWRLLGLASLSYTVGMAAWFVIEGVLGRPPFPSVAALGPILWYPLALAALLAFSRSAGSRAGGIRSVILDAAVFVIGAGVVIGSMFAPVSASLAGDPGTALVSSAFATGDLLLLIGVLHSDIRTQKVASVRFVLLGIACIVLGDIAFAMALQQNATSTSGLPDVFFCTAWVPIGLGAYRDISEARAGRGRRSIVDRRVVDDGIRLLPYAAIAVGVALLVWVGLRNLNSDTGPITLCAVAATVLLTIRQSLIARANTKALVEARSQEGWDRFMRLIEHGTDVILLIDCEGVVRYATPSAERLLGYPPEMLVGQSAEGIAGERLIHDRLVQAMTRPLLASGEPLEIPFQRPDGTTNTLELIATRALDDSGSSVLVVNVRDVSERHATIEAIRASEGRLVRLAQVLNATPDLVCSFAVDGRITYTNAAFRRLVGIPEDDTARMIDTTLSRFPDVGRVLLDTAMAHAVSAGFWHGDVEFTADGDERPISLIVLAHRSPGEATDSFSFIGRDIRDRRRTERALTRARDAADAASRAKTEFLATMSHEIRTPMNGIIGATELLLATRMTADQRDLAETLYDSSEALLGIINNILDFSKIEAGSLDLERISFDPRRTVAGVRGVLGVVAGSKGLDFTVSVDDAVPGALIGDPGRLRQILTNLVGNAIKFTNEGEVTLQLRAVDRPEIDRTTVHFEVRDTGIGIEEDCQAHLFQPFAQADGSMSRRFGGTGLGLAISHRLVEGMGGLLGLRSRPGEGSTFWFDLTFDNAATAPSEGDWPDIDSTGMPTEHMRGTRAVARIGTGVRTDAAILVVEDNEVNRRVALATLTRLGYRPDVAADGYEALRAAGARAYDVIVMDCQMPGMDGFEATRLIRAHEAGRRHVSIVALTANATASDRDRCLAAGMDAYLAKPVRPAAIRAVLAQLLEAPPEGSVAPERAAETTNEVQSSEGLPEFEPSATAWDEEEILDVETIMSIRSLADDETFESLVQLFLDQSAVIVKSISFALLRGEDAEMRRLAHTLKGSSRSLGAIRVGSVASNLETINDDAFDALALAAELSDAIEATRSAFARERDRHVAILTVATRDSQSMPRGNAA